MPPRHNRNTRKKDTNAYTHPVISQQPTPSPRPSPDIYPIALPETTTSRGRPPGSGPGLGVAAVLPTPTHSLSEERESRLLTPPLPEPEPPSVAPMQREPLDVGFGGSEGAGMAEALDMAEEFGNQRPLLDLDMDEAEETTVGDGAAQIRALSPLDMESEPESVSPPPAIVR
ncbi:hypothetical protein Moror_5524 [Moniliophthora roreri MCA 2997]|nr:hypothetical protein Moror_5524 [Moniliophthora roreri MCA 2997]